MTSKELVKFSITCKEQEAKKIADKVCDMVKAGATMEQVQMYLFNNWIKKSQPELVQAGYES